MDGESDNINPKFDYDDCTDEYYDRLSILIDEANKSYDRDISNIAKINSKIFTVFQIFLVLITLQVSMVAFLPINPSIITNYEFFCLICAVGYAIFGVCILLFLIWPKSYNVPDIFEENRFKELCSFTKDPLLRDILDQIKNSYLNNKPVYTRLIKGLKISIVLMLLNVVFFILFILLYVVDNHY